MRKVDDGEEKKKEKKRMTFIVANSVVASGPPEHRPTGTPNAHAKIAKKHIFNLQASICSALPLGRQFTDTDVL